MPCPLEFPLQINFLPMIVYCTKLHETRRIQSLQTDLDHLQEWERDWRMVFNPDGCNHIQITNKRNVMKTSFNIHGQTLIETSKAKYLVVTIDSKLPWNYDVPNGSRFISILFHLKYNQLSISQSRSSSKKKLIFQKYLSGPK